MGTYVPPSWRLSIYINYLELCCTGNLALLTHLFIYSIVYISMDSWIFIFIFWVRIQYDFIYFVAQIVPTLAFGSFLQLVSVFLWHAPFILVFFSPWALSYFLTLQDPPVSSCIFPALSSRIRHFLKALWLLFLEEVIRY